MEKDGLLEIIASHRSGDDLDEACPLLCHTYITH